MDGWRGPQNRHHRHRHHRHHAPKFVSQNPALVTPLHPPLGVPERASSHTSADTRLVGQAIQSKMADQR
jgi:hypothetical protein